MKGQWQKNSVFRLLELVARGNDDKIKTNPLLAYDEAKGWIMQGMVPGVSTQGITFDRERTDKQPTVTDVRLSQLTDMYDISKENLYKPFMSLIPIGMLGAYGLSRYEKQTNV